MGETRNFERYPVEVPARVELLRSRRKNKVLSLKTCNLSALGAFFPEWQPISVGIPVKAEFYLVFENQHANEVVRDLVVMTVEGTVVRTDSSGTAVSFAENYEMKTYQGLVRDAKIHQTDELPAAAGMP